MLHDAISAVVDVAGEAAIMAGIVGLGIGAHLLTDPAIRRQRAANRAAAAARRARRNLAR